MAAARNIEDATRSRRNAEGEFRRTVAPASHLRLRQIKQRQGRVCYTFILKSDTPGIMEGRVLPLPSLPAIGTTRPARSVMTLLAGSCMLVAVAARSQTPAADTASDPVKGRAFALEECTFCHLVESRQAFPPLLPDAPPFKAVAKAKETTAVSLAAFLNGQHRTMPYFILSPQQERDVIGYILRLRDEP